MVFLERHDTFLQAVSFERARKTGEWHKRGRKSPLADRESLRADVQWIIRQRDNLDEKNSLAKRILNNHEVLHLVYETDLLQQEMHPVTAEKVFRFLGLRTTSVQARLRKVSGRVWYDGFANKNELIDAYEMHNAGGVAHLTTN